MKAMKKSLMVADYVKGGLPDSAVVLIAGIASLVPPSINTVKGGFVAE